MTAPTTRPTRPSRPGSGPLHGKAALVTGSSRGLGLLIARELADRGCRVLLCARGRGELDAARRQLAERGAEVRALACDLTDPQAPGRLMDAMETEFGGVDILVNNAGVIQVGPLAAMAEEDFRSAMDVMFYAPLRLTLAALPMMRRRPGGRIVNITSIGGRVPAPHLLPYDTAKFAATALSEGLHAELAAEGISVTTVLPGLMRTGSHTAARFSGDAGKEYAWFGPASGLPLLSMDAERAARAIVRAAERRRTELVLTPAAKLAVRMHGVAPATTTKALSLACRLLPGPGTAADHNLPGAAAAGRLGSALVNRLTALNDRAARRLNQRATV